MKNILYILLSFGLMPLFSQSIFNPEFELKKHQPKKIKSDRSTTSNRLRITYRFKDRSEFYGFVNLNGDTIIPVVFDYAERFKNDMAKVYLNGYWGIIDTMGNFIVKPEYQGFLFFKKGFPMFKKEYWGYFNSKFETIIESKFIAAGNFKNNKALVLTKNKDIALIDTSGNIVSTLSKIPSVNQNNDLYSKKDQVKNLRPNKSYLSLRNYVKDKLSLPEEDIYFMYWSSSPKSLTNAIQKLKYNCVFWIEAGWEWGEYYLRIPHISYNDGVALAFQIVGHYLKSFEVTENETILRLNDEAASNKFKILQKEGYIEISQYTET